jgi:hypothetical protein
MPPLESFIKTYEGLEVAQSESFRNTLSIGNVPFVILVKKYPVKVAGAEADFDSQARRNNVLFRGPAGGARKNRKTGLRAKRQNERFTTTLPRRETDIGSFRRYDMLHFLWHSQASSYDESLVIFAEIPFMTCPGSGKILAKPDVLRGVITDPIAYINRSADYSHICERDYHVSRGFSRLSNASART